MNEDNKTTQFNTEALKPLLVEQFEEFQNKELGVEREQLKELLSFKNNPFAIIVSGLRRVGKSTLLAQAIHKLYKSDEYYYVNFDDNRFINFTVKDFTKLYQILIELFGEKKVFVFDEIQNILGWEVFIRRMIDSGSKIYITGSNAHLLSRELGTRLTGRYIPIELLPFSFNEFLTFKKKNFSSKVLTTKEHANLNRLLKEYILKGGIPDALKYIELPFHENLYNDVLYRDIITRYSIDEVKSLKELALYLISNPSCLVSYNNLKNSLQLGSVNTVKSFIEYFENSWLLFSINKFAFSVKTQQIAAKKSYVIDTGLANTIGFSFSPNIGKLLENLVFLDLKRNKKEVFYYKTKNLHEIDFFIRKEGLFIQVCYDMALESTKTREVKGLFEAMDEQKQRKGIIVTFDYSDKIVRDKKEIVCIPYYEFSRFKDYKFEQI